MIEGVLCTLPDQAGQRAAGDALSMEAARLGGHFEALEARIEEAKSLAAAACQPMSGARKVHAAPCWLQVLRKQVFGRTWPAALSVIEGVW